jgi:tetratricopeptide (TPR) repeat protein
MNLSGKFRVIIFFVGLLAVFFMQFVIWRSYRAHSVFFREQAQALPEIVEVKVKYYKQILKQLEQAAGLNPLNAEYHFALAQAVSKIVEDADTAELRGLFSPFLGAEDAEKEYLFALRLDPVNARYHLELGFFYARAGKEGLAEEEFVKAGDSGGNDASLHYDLAGGYLSFFGDSKLSDAIQGYRKAFIWAAPEFQRQIMNDLYAKFGYDYILQGGILPDTARARYCLAELLWKQGRYDESLREFREAISLSGKDDKIIKANSLAWIGLIYKIKNDVKESIYYLEAAVKIDPHNGWSLYNLGDAYYRVGELDKATLIFEEALRHNPDEYTKKEIMKVLRQSVPTYR